VNEPVMPNANKHSAFIELSESQFLVRKVLLVDADRALRNSIAQFLAEHHFLVFEADNGPAARELLASISPDVVILDVLVPGEDGLAIVRDLSVRSDLSVILLSSLSSEMDRIIGLEAGADDYLAKPPSLRELLARIRAVGRRGARPGRDSDATRLSYCFVGWRLDPESRELRDSARALVTLSDGEFAVLRSFVERPQRVLTRDQLLEFARGPDSDAYDRAIDTQVSRLRRKLGGRARDAMIRTVRSEGYMFMPRVELG
jgi:two-component system OmpR family response regulator